MWAGRAGIAQELLLPLLLSSSATTTTTPNMWGPSFPGAYCPSYNKQRACSVPNYSIVLVSSLDRPCGGPVGSSSRQSNNGCAKTRLRMRRSFPPSSSCAVVVVVVVVVVIGVNTSAYTMMTRKRNGATRRRRWRRSGSCLLYTSPSPRDS